MRTIVIALILLSIPVTILGTPTLGIFFTINPYQMHYHPAQWEIFDAYLFGHNLNCPFTTAVELKLGIVTPGIIIQGTQYIPGPPFGPTTITMGDPLTAFAITYHPESGVNCQAQSWCLFITFKFLAWKACYDAGGPDAIMADEVVVVLGFPPTPNPRATCWDGDNHTIIDLVGLTSIICPDVIGAEEESWGAIKSMYK